MVEAHGAIISTVGKLMDKDTAPLVTPSSQTDCDLGELETSPVQVELIVRLWSTGT